MRMDEHLEGGLCDLGGDGVSAIGAARAVQAGW